MKRDLRASRSRGRRCVFAAAALLSLNSSAFAAILIGNLPQPNDGDGTQISAANPENQKALSFTVSNAPFDVSSIDLRLSGYRTSSGDVASVGIYGDNGGTPGSLIGSIFNSPASASGNVGTFSFSGSATLEPNTRYWLVVDATAGDYYWRGASPAVAPSGAATFGSYLLSTDNGATYVPSDVANSFQINSATPVPEPAEITIAASIGLIGFAAFRRIRAKHSIPAI